MCFQKMSNSTRRTKFNLFKRRKNKPLYRKFNQIYEDPQLKKIFKLKKEKWEKLQDHLKKRYFYRKAPVLLDQNNSSLLFFFSKRYAKRHKDFLHSGKTLNLFYGGGLRRNYMKNVIKKVNKKQANPTKGQSRLGLFKLLFVDFMERRLDAVLHRSLFIKSVQNARQLITHGYVFVNGNVIKTSSFCVQNGDKIEIDIKFHKYVLFNIKTTNHKSLTGLTPSKNLAVNYKTLQIFYKGFSNTDTTSLSNLFHFSLNLENAINYYKYN